MSNYFRRTAMFLTVATIAMYLVYRAGWTLNLSGPWTTLFSVTLYLSELYGASLLLLYFFNIWEVIEPAPAPPLAGRTVDVLIPTYNEDPNLLRGTISAAMAIQYPHRTYVLDDGRRPEVRQLSAELGANYICRDNNLHAKAGNLNNALDQTDGEFVVIFDADQLSAPDFISRLIGYFTDDRLAFVQTPHAFYNYDSFQASLDYKRDLYWEEGELFYNLVQPGKNRWNAVMFCGSAAIFRRTALNDVGLIATETITEDMHTGLRLHAKGWKSLFVNERLICAQAAPDITAFQTQRLRWGEGNLGVFFYDNPFTMRGLTLPQRLSYIGSMLSWTTGLQKLFLYLTPVIMLLTGVAPVNRLTQLFALITLSYLAAIWIGVKLVGRGHSRLIAEELSHMSSFWTQCRSLYRAVVNRKTARFIVTSKRGRQSTKAWPYILPQILYITLAFSAVTWAASRYYLGLSNDYIGLVVGSLLACVHAMFAGVVVCRSRRAPDRRYAWRHPCAAHVQYETTTADGVVAGQGVTQDLNEHGVGLIAFQRLPKSELLRLSITAGGTSVRVWGRIRHEPPVVVRRVGSHGTVAAYRYGIQFEDQTAEQLGKLWSLCAGYAVSRQYERFNNARDRRQENRRDRLPTAREVRLPVTFVAADQQEAVDATVTEWLTADKFACLLPQRLEKDARRQFRIETPFGQVQGEAVVAGVAEYAIDGRILFMHRFEIGEFAGQSRGVVQSILQTLDRPETRAVIAPIPGVQHTPIFRLLASSLVPGAIVAAGVVAVSLVVYREEITLVRLARGGTPTTRDLEILDRYAERAAAGKIPDREMLTLIFAGLKRLDRQEQMSAIWDSPAADLRMTPDERLSRAQIRAGTDHPAKAEEDFQILLAHVGEPAPAGLAPEKLPEMYLSAARNSSHAGDGAAAALRYARAFQLTPDDHSLAVEYAGVLISQDRDAEAITLLKTAPHDEHAQRLLATAYVREKEFTLALAVYRDLLQHSPHDPKLQHDQANALAWSGDFGAATEQYRKLLVVSPDDRELKTHLARALLGGRHYGQALELLRPLLDENDSDPQLQQDFLNAAASAEKLTASDRRLTLDILGSTRGELAGRKPEFGARLADVLGRLHDVARLIPVLKDLVESDPDNAELRRRLADALSDAGLFDDAELQYRLLLTRRRFGEGRGDDRPGDDRRGDDRRMDDRSRDDRPRDVVDPRNIP